MNCAFLQQNSLYSVSGRPLSLTTPLVPQACMKNTFDFIVQEMVPEGYQGHPGLRKTDKPFDFFYQVLQQMQTVENEDRKVYSPRLAK